MTTTPTLCDLRSCSYARHTTRYGIKLCQKHAYRLDKYGDLNGIDMPADSIEPRFES
ncbi:hypothetical protein IU485_08755 [Nocardia cyriacigeorgica]|uniref:hypothetical protein n=1 Tax=Nocardia cyriacigeorgica TaxID=135487 RepID=UPI001892F9BE|nr:hypothetical protein [Nocardia cyriacigeorgica]MBF6081443.1 hypothetical protein [Nocardia cyriacigeorgica]MBF6090890.1 hypothetical protein [Nocardia cyriacigeorgica]